MVSIDDLFGGKSKLVDQNKPEEPKPAEVKPVTVEIPKEPATKPVEAKGEIFKFKSAKGQNITVDFKGDFKDKKKTEKALKEIVDLIQVDDKPKKKIEEVKTLPEEKEESEGKNE